MRLTADGMPRLSLQAFKALVREQYFMLLIDEAAALAAIPSLLPSGAKDRRKALAILREVVTARGELVGEASRRMERITRLFEADPSQSNLSSAPTLQPALDDDRALASPAGGGDGEPRVSADTSNQGVIPWQSPRSIDHPRSHASKYERLIARAKEVPPATTIVVHPCDETSLRGADRGGARPASSFRSWSGRPNKITARGTRAQDRHRAMRSRRCASQRCRGGQSPSS